MKLWKKIYLITLLIFLILINLGIYLVFDMTYKKDITVEQNRTLSTFQIFQSALLRNMKTLDEQGRLESPQIIALLETYEYYYQSQKVSLGMWDETKCIYPSSEAKKELDFSNGSKATISIVTENKIKTIYVTCTIDDFSKKYYLSFCQPLTELTNTWNELQKRYIFISLAFSVILALILLLVLRRLTKPIHSLSNAVNEMKTLRDYSSIQVNVKGKDDIAELGRSFNEMANIISDNLAHIKKDSDSKQVFIDNFAHELKSPLTSIYGFAEYVGKANISDGEKQECMNFIMEESNRILNLSYTLLDLSKLRNMDISMEFINTEHLCKQILLQLKNQLSEKDIDFSYIVDINKIYGNELLLHSLLGNLIRNAFYACGKKGKITLTIKKENDECQIIIQDNGCGMTKEDLEHITEPFYRVDKARSRKNGGTGLGLSLCNQIVQAHHGTLVFHSEPAVGTTVTVTIPETHE